MADVNLHVSPPHNRGYGVSGLPGGHVPDHVEVESRLKNDGAITLSKCADTAEWLAYLL